MKNILNKESLCTHFPQVEIRSKSRLLPTITTLIGIIILSLSISLKDAENLSTALLTIGVVILAIGIIKLIRPSQMMVFASTGERVVRRIEGHSQEVKAEIEASLRSGDFEAITPLIAKGSCAPLVSVTYTTPSGSLRIGQVLHYIPYEYEPLTEAFAHIKR